MSTPFRGIREQVTSGITPVSGSGVVQHIALVRDFETIGDFDTIADWSVLNNDTDNLEARTDHVLGSNSVEFDKVDGAGNTVFCGASSTITSLDISRFGPHDFIETAFTVSDSTNIDYVFIRIGTDASNYNEWRVADTALTDAVWDTHRVEVADTELSVTGNGWDMTAITYIAVGVAFDVETQTLADIAFDHVLVTGSTPTVT